MRGRNSLARPHLIRRQRLSTAERAIERVRAWNGDSLVRQLAPIAGEGTNAAGDAGLDDRVIDVGDHRQPVFHAGDQNVSFHALLALAVAPAQGERFPDKVNRQIELRLQRQVEMDEAFAIAHRLFAQQCAVLPLKLQRHLHARRFAGGELREHGANGARAAGAVEARLGGTQCSCGKDQPAAAAIAEVGLDADRGRAEQIHRPRAVHSARRVGQGRSAAP